MTDKSGDSPSWRRQRRSGMAAVALSSGLLLLLWGAVFSLVPVPTGMNQLEDRLVLTAKCLVLATLYCLAAGFEAVAHERLQTSAFDPLMGTEGRRLRVNQRYLQNTLEQLILFGAALTGLAIYLTGETAARVLIANTAVWIVARFAFWVGYHRSSALRGLGVPGMMLSLLALLYVAFQIGIEVAGTAGGIILVGAFLILEALLLILTRSSDPAGAGPDIRN